MIYTLAWTWFKWLVSVFSTFKNRIFRRGFPRCEGNALPLSWSSAISRCEGKREPLARRVRWNQTWLDGTVAVLWDVVLIMMTECGGYEGSTSWTAQRWSLFSSPTRATCHWVPRVCPQRKIRLNPLGHEMRWQNENVDDNNDDVKWWETLDFLPFDLIAVGAFFRSLNCGLVSRSCLIVLHSWMCYSDLNITAPLSLASIFSLTAKNFSAAQKHFPGGPPPVEETWVKDNGTPRNADMVDLDSFYDGRWIHEGLVFLKLWDLKVQSCPKFTSVGWAGTRGRDQWEKHHSTNLMGHITRK